MRGPDTTGDGVGGRPLGAASIIDIIGGSSGVAAAYAEVLTLADAVAATGDLQETAAAKTRSVTANPELLESGLLSPTTAVLAETAVLAAAVALVAGASAWRADAAAIRGTVVLLQDADEVAQAEMNAMDYQLERALGFSLVRLPSVTGWTLLALALAGAPSDRVLTDHPRLVTHLMNGSGGLLDGLAAGLGLPVLFDPRVEDGARLLSAAYGDEGDPLVRVVPTTALSGALLGSTTQPGSMRDLIAHLGRVAGLSQDSDSPLNGTIEVQTIRGADGRVRHIVYLPGTDDLTTTPWSQDQDVRDMATNLQLMAGEDDTYQRGIQQALLDAGVRPDEPVALVGHSQGGMEGAALLAHHSDLGGSRAGAGSLHITDVVTAGSPTAQVGAFPAGSHVLSLEQRGDIVPALDGRAPQDTVAQTTVTFDARPGDTVLAQHSYPAYVAGAAAADASTDASVRTSIATLHAHGFLGNGSGVTVSSQIFQITRG